MLVNKCKTNFIFNLKQCGGWCLRRKLFHCWFDWQVSLMTLRWSVECQLISFDKKLFSFTFFVNKLSPNWIFFCLTSIHLIHLIILQLTNSLHFGFHDVKASIHQNPFIKITICIKLVQFVKTSFTKKSLICQTRNSKQSNDEN